MDGDALVLLSVLDCAFRFSALRCYLVWQFSVRVIWDCRQAVPVNFIGVHPSNRRMWTHRATLAEFTRLAWLHSNCALCTSHITLHIVLFSSPLSKHQNFYTSHFIPCILYLTLYTSLSILYTVHLRFHNWPSHFTFATQYLTRDTPHFTLYMFFTLLSTLCTLRSTLHTLHCKTLGTLHRIIWTIHFIPCTLYTLHFAPHHWKSILCTHFWTLSTATGTFVSQTVLISCLGAFGFVGFILFSDSLKLDDESTFNWWWSSFWMGSDHQMTKAYESLLGEWTPIVLLYCV